MALPLFKFANSSHINFILAIQLRTTFPIDTGLDAPTELDDDADAAEVDADNADDVEEKPPQPNSMKVVNGRKSSLLRCIERNEIVHRKAKSNSTKAVHFQCEWIHNPHRYSPSPIGIRTVNTSRDSIAISKLCILTNPSSELLLSSLWKLFSLSCNPASMLN